MRRVVSVVVVILCVSALFLSGCGEYEYKPTGEFYTKTAPSRGDTGVNDVIDIEAQECSFEGEGELSIDLTVGFGHLPDHTEDYGERELGFYAVYRVFEWGDAQAPIWEKRVDYSEKWSDSKFNSTAQKNPPSLIFPRYGEFYPLYKESVEFVFPEGAERGWCEVALYRIIEDAEDGEFASLRFDFKRENGALTLVP